jgi:hypothetical protein
MVAQLAEIRWLTVSNRHARVRQTEEADRQMPAIAGPVVGNPQVSVTGVPGTETAVIAAGVREQAT